MDRCKDLSSPRRSASHSLFRLRSARHVKCDEEKPACRRCISIRRACPGYEDRNQRRPNPYSTNSCGYEVIVRNPSPDVFESEPERRAFAYFSLVVKRQLSRVYCREFWHHLVLQMAVLDSGTRHALIALASVYECLGNHGMSRSTEEFAIKQYNIAIGHHKRSLSGSTLRESTEHYLVSCIIFICIEVYVLVVPAAWLRESLIV